MIIMRSTRIGAETDLDRHNNAMDVLNEQEFPSHVSSGWRLVQVTFQQDGMESVMEHIWQTEK